MEHWEYLMPGGLRFVWADNLFRPGTDTFLLSSLPRLKPHYHWRGDPAGGGKSSGAGRGRK